MKYDERRTKRARIAPRSCSRPQAPGRPPCASPSPPSRLGGAFRPTLDLCAPDAPQRNSSSVQLRRSQGGLIRPRRGVSRAFHPSNKDARVMELVIGDKNQTTRALRPWLVMKRTGAPFTETVVRLDQPDTTAEILKHSPTGQAPALHFDGGEAIWDSMAISVLLAECFF